MTLESEKPLVRNMEQRKEDEGQPRTIHLLNGCIDYRDRSLLTSFTLALGL